jgi:hypothetical protein
VLQEVVVIADQRVPFVRRDVGDPRENFELDDEPPGAWRATARARGQSTKLATAVKAWNI